MEYEEQEREIALRREERQRLQTSQPELFAEITGILARHDLVWLVEIGAPEDEYEAETGTILPRLNGAADPDDVADILSEEFVRWFSADVPMKSLVHFREAADEIWSAWSRHALSDL